MGGGEDHHRTRVRLQRPQQLDAGLLGELDVEEEEVRLQLSHQLGGGAGVVGLPDHRDAALAAEERAQTGAGERLVFDDEGAENAHGPTSSDCNCSGIFSSVTTCPFSLRQVIEVRSGKA
jgi:hypothetical protein